MEGEGYGDRVRIARFHEESLDDDTEHYWICFTFDEFIVLNGKLLIRMNLTSPFF